MFVPFYACKHAYESICVCVCVYTCTCRSLHYSEVDARCIFICQWTWYTLYTIIHSIYRSPVNIFFSFYVFQQHRLKSCDSGENIRSHLEISALKCRSCVLTSKMFQTMFKPREIVIFTQGNCVFSFVAITSGIKPEREFKAENKSNKTL